MEEIKYWEISYLPMKDSGEIGWVYSGTESQLNQYLLDNHGCNCADCIGKDWWDTAQSCEYIVEEIVK